VTNTSENKRPDKRKMLSGAAIKVILKEGLKSEKRPSLWE
jgi:hypothetical protein